MSTPHTTALRRPRREGGRLVLGHATLLARQTAVDSRWETVGPSDAALADLLSQAYQQPADRIRPIIKAVCAARAALIPRPAEADALLSALPEPPPQGIAALTRRHTPGTQTAAPLGLPPVPAHSPTLCLTDRGVVLGKGTIIASLRPYPDGVGLDITGNEDRILTLLSLAGDGLVDPERVLTSFHAASHALRRGETVRGAIALCHLNQPPLHDDTLTKGLTLADQLLTAGMSPLTLLKRQSLLPTSPTGFGESEHPRAGEGGPYPARFVPKNEPAAKACFNPDEPRRDKGEPQAGCWVDANGGGKNPQTGIKINWAFIGQLEGNILIANVPGSSSGVTIGSGVDLSEKDEKYLEDIGVPPALVKKLSPYLGKKGAEAIKANDEHKLVITNEDAKILNQCIKSQMTKDIIMNYNRDVNNENKSKNLENKLKIIQELKENEQTVIMSLGYNMGPNFKNKAEKMVEKYKKTGKNPDTWENRIDLWNNLVKQNFNLAAENIQYAADHEKDKNLAPRRLKERAYLLDGAFSSGK